MASVKEKEMEMPPRKDRRVTVLLDKELYERFKADCDRRHRSLSNSIRYLIETQIERDENESRQQKN